MSDEVSEFQRKRDLEERKEQLRSEVADILLRQHELNNKLTRACEEILEVVNEITRLDDKLMEM